MKQKLSKDAKTAIALVSVFIVLLAMYAVNAVYQNRTGKIETEFIVSYSEEGTLAVDGFAVRDESIEVDGKNTLVLYKDKNLVYVPVISDSENVSKNGIIALAFSSEDEAEAYMEETELREKLGAIKELQSNEDLSYSNVLFLNSQISASVVSYISAVSDSSVSDISSHLESISNNITSKQIATGADLDFDSIIKDYSTKINQLKSSYKIVKRITSPYAGYFVSSVDGYENTKSYNDVKNKKLLNGDGEKLIKSKPANYEGAYGKIIAQPSWYYVFDLPIEKASILKTDYWVTVAFPELGLSDIDMKVHDITQAKDGMITVTLRCTSMNEELSKVRKEQALITVDDYSGYKISNEAIAENDDGVIGVYAIVGNIMKFSPLDVKFYGEGYVVAVGKRVLRDENDEDSGYYHVLRQYDKIIVKGINLEDGNIVG